MKAIRNLILKDYFNKNRKEKFMILNETDIREFLFEKNLVNEKYNWWAIEDTVDIDNFNETISEYENNIKLLIKKLVNDDESISKQLEILTDEIESKRERKLSIINKPQTGELYIDFTYSLGGFLSFSSNNAFPSSAHSMYNRYTLCSRNILFPLLIAFASNPWMSILITI